jgi:protein ImuA
LRHDPALEALHAQIEKIEGRSRRVKAVLPFGIVERDSRLPGGGLAYGALHEVAGGGSDAVNGAAAALFATGVLPARAARCCGASPDQTFLRRRSRKRA